MSQCAHISSTCDDKIYICVIIIIIIYDTTPNNYVVAVEMSDYLPPENFKIFSQSLLNYFFLMIPQIYAKHSCVNTHLEIDLSISDDTCVCNLV